MKEIYTAPEHLHDDHSYRTTIAVGFGIALPAIAIPLRLWARRLQGLKLKGDDYAIIIAAILTIGNSCVPILADSNGNGRHEETLTKENLKNYFLALFIFEQTFGVAVAAVKISILLLCRRIFVTQTFRISTTILMVLILAWVLVKNLVGAFQCTPVKKAWLKKTPGHCINFIDLVIYAQACNIIFDMAILILPIREIYKLQLSPLKKVGVMAIFAVGSFSIISAIVRIAVIASEVNEYGRNLPDVTWFTSKWTWTVLDPAIGCFAACMPTWVPLVKPLARVGEYASLLGSRLRITLSRSTHRSAVKLNDEPGNGNENSYYLAAYKQPAQWDMEVQVTGGQRSDSRGSEQELYPATELSKVEQPNRGVKVKREFRQEEYRRNTLSL